AVARCSVWSMPTRSGVNVGPFRNEADTVYDPRPGDPTVLGGGGALLAGGSRQLRCPPVKPRVSSNSSHLRANLRWTFRGSSGKSAIALPFCAIPVPREGAAWR